MWFTEAAAGRIGRITTAGLITEFSSGISGSSEPRDIVRGPDGNLWFTMSGLPGSIGRITPESDVTEFSDGLTLASVPREIAAGPDGDLWFTESATPGRIGRITTAGDITEYSTGLLSILSPWSIAAGPDGNMWFTGNNIPGKIGRITLPPLVRDLAADQLATTSARLRGKLRPNSQATDYHFEYGPTDAYGSTTPTVYAGSGYDLLTVMANVDGLTPATKYHFRLVATNDAGTTVGPDRIFATQALLAEPSTTGPAPPEKAEPDFGKTVVVEPEGTVRVKTPGGEWGRFPPARSCRWARRSTRASETWRSAAVAAAAARRPALSAAASSRCASRAPGAAASTCTCAAGTSRAARASRAGIAAVAGGPPRRRARSACASSGGATTAAASAATAGTATRPCAAPAG
jgi:hypothetical protein